MYEEEVEGNQGRHGLPVDTGRVLVSVRRGWRLVPLSILAGIALGVCAALLMKPLFSAETVLIWEPTQAPRRGDRQISTHTGILTLPRVLKETRDRLGLKVGASTLADRIETHFDASSNLVRIGAFGYTGEAAAGLANTLVQVFLDYQQELARTRASEDVETLEGDLATARATLRAAQEKYDAFRAQNDVTDPAAEAAAALDTVARLKTQQAASSAEITALDAMATRLDQLAAKQPRTRVVSSTSASPEAERLARARADLASAEVHLAPDHPRVQSLKAQIAALEQRVAAGKNEVQATVVAPDPQFDSMRASLSATRAEQAAAAERSKSYEQTLRSAESRLAQLKALEARARDFSVDIETATRRVEELKGLLMEAHEVERAPAVEFRVLTPAAVPSTPDTSRRLLVVAGLAALGLFGALAFLVLRPLGDGRVHTAREAAFWAKLPVIASTTWPSRAQQALAFVNELSDDALRTKGTTLILGLGDRESVLAGELASGLNPSRPPEVGIGEHDGMGADPSDPPSSEAAGFSSTALARKRPLPRLFLAWPQGMDVPSLRRAVRMSDRVIILVSSGEASIRSMLDIRSVLGREEGVGLVLLGVPDEFVELPDRVGDVEGFWRPRLLDAAAA